MSNYPNLFITSIKHAYILRHHSMFLSSQITMHESRKQAPLRPQVSCVLCFPIHPIQSRNTRTHPTLPITIPMTTMSCYVMPCHVVSCHGERIGWRLLGPSDGILSPQCEPGGRAFARDRRGVGVRRALRGGRKRFPHLARDQPHDHGGGGGVHGG